VGIVDQYSSEDTEMKIEGHNGSNHYGKRVIVGQAELSYKRDRMEI
jgi:hypothetical protein